MSAQDRINRILREERELARAQMADDLEKKFKGREDITCEELMEVAQRMIFQRERPDFKKGDPS